MGVSCGSVHRFFTTTRQADRQRSRGVIQRNPAEGVPRRTLVQFSQEANEMIEAWRREYNESRPHWVDGERTPHEIACEFAASRELTSTKTEGDSLSG